MLAVVGGVGAVDPGIVLPAAAAAAEEERIGARGPHALSLAVDVEVD